MIWWLLFRQRFFGQLGPCWYSTGNGLGVMIHKTSKGWEVAAVRLVDTSENMYQNLPGENVFHSASIWEAYKDFQLLKLRLQKGRPQVA